MPEERQTKTIKSLWWLLVKVAGKLIEHGRRLVPKIAVSVEKYEIYLEKMRRRAYGLLLE
jgi:hypothetical protein